MVENTSVERFQTSAMKPVTVFVSFLCLVPTLSYNVVPFKVREIPQKFVPGGVEQRIYNGNAAAEGQFPYMILAIMKFSQGHLAKCSSSLVTPEWVLLAAHCLSFARLDARNIILVGGRSRVEEYVKERLEDYYAPIDEERFGLQERRGGEYYIHPKYDDINLHHDVALVKVNKPFVLGKVHTIPLATEEMVFRMRCTIVGWGLISGNNDPFKLYYAQNREVSTTKIGCIYKTEGSFICLKPGDSGICQGDSGSPLVCNGQVWGVASHFVSENENPDCGDALEGYYTELYPDIRWLNKVMNGSAFSSTALSFESVLVCAFAALFYGRTTA